MVAPGRAASRAIQSVGISSEQWETGERQSWGGERECPGHSGNASDVEKPPATRVARLPSIFPDLS